jgi:Mn-dependent DtxR family transcriptional regulator
MDLTDEEKQLLKASRKADDGDAAFTEVWVAIVAEMLGISVDACAKILGSLKKKGMITVCYEGLAFQLTPSGVEASES